MKSFGWFSIGLLCFTCKLAVGVGRITYKGYKIYEVAPDDELQSETLYNLSISNHNLNFLNLQHYVTEPLHVVVPPKEQFKFEETLAQSSIKIKILTADLAEKIKEEQVINPRTNVKTTQINFNRYYRHKEINSYLDVLAQQYPNRVQVKTVGHSYEGRPIKAITITNGVQEPKKVIFIDAGIHAREWIAPVTALYIIYQLVEGFSSNQNLLKNYNWIIIPSVNPDGYEHSLSYNRLWRKTRKPNLNCGPTQSGSSWTQSGIVYDRCSLQYVPINNRVFSNSPNVRSICGFGTDGNRNYDSHWAQMGTSNNPCNDKYHGTQAFSEVETQIVRDVMHNIGRNAKMYLSLHSYGSYLLYPWGYTKNLPTNWRDIEDVAYAGSNAISQTTGRKYHVGSLTNILYPASGGSIDYAMEKVGIPISLCMELPFGGSGFDPSPAEILNLVGESWVGIRAMAHRLQQKF